MVPKLVTEIFHVFQVRVQETHQLNNRIGIALALLAVLNSEQVFHHFLNMPAIFLHDQVVPGRIVFHVLYVHHIGKYKFFYWEP